MKIFGIIQENFYVAEHELKNYIKFTSTLEKAKEYVLNKYGVNCELNESVVYDEDEDLGELSVIIHEIEVQ